MRKKNFVNQENCNDVFCYNQEGNIKRVENLSKENLYKIRVGDYRIVYQIEDAVCIVSVRNIGNRKDVYDK